MKPQTSHGVIPTSSLLLALGLKSYCGPSVVAATLRRTFFLPGPMNPAGYHRTCSGAGGRPRVWRDAQAAAGQQESSRMLWHSRPAGTCVERVSSLHPPVDGCPRICAVVGATLRIGAGCDWPAADWRDDHAPGGRDRVTQSGSEGQFDFQGLPEGEYESRPHAAGFATARQPPGSRPDSDRPCH